MVEAEVVVAKAEVVWGGETSPVEDRLVGEEITPRPALGYLGHPGQIGGWWVPQNDVTMEAVRADDYFPIAPVEVLTDVGGRPIRRSNKFFC